MKLISDEKLAEFKKEYPSLYKIAVVFAWAVMISAIAGAIYLIIKLMQ
jgi:hypothetical protein